MLQQTQVTTVIDYYNRFVKRFPNVSSLAEANQDEVLHLWAGLGYYARARNLHKTAQLIHNEYKSQFPQNIEEVVALPGIGPSTAGAVLAFAFDQHHAILDGNVKRVLSRVFAIDGYPGNQQVSQTMWTLAKQLTPKKEVAQYTQAIMDLGAMICVRSKPVCPQCPFIFDCQARASNLQDQYPTPKPKRNRPVKHVVMLMLSNDNGEVFLQQRAQTGIWGGLWSFPEFDPEENLKEACFRRFGFDIASDNPEKVVKHAFTHYELIITPVTARLEHENVAVMEAKGQVWYNATSSGNRGFPAPVKRLLDKHMPST